IAANHFRDKGDFAVGIAGVFPFRGKGEVKVAARLQAGADLEDFAQVFVRGARIGGGFEDDESSLLEVPGNVASGIQDVGNVGFAVFIQGRGDTDDDGLDFANAAEVARGGKKARADGVSDG